MEGGYSRYVRAVAFLIVGLMATSSFAVCSASGMFVNGGQGSEIATRSVLPLHPSDTIDAPIGDVPFADAGPDQIVTAGTEVMFDASGSFDPDGYIANYEWYFLDSGFVTLYGSTPSYIFSNAMKYPIEVTLFVTDDSGFSSSDTMLVTVWPADVVVEKKTAGVLGNSKIWTVACPTYGAWTLEIENHGLSSMILTGWERSGFGSARIFSRAVIFLTQGAYPEGTAYGPTVHMWAGNFYQVNALPLGPVGAYAVVRNVFVSDNQPPIAEFSYVIEGLNVSVDASSSSDPNGDPLSYVWDWGDGLMGYGVSATHSYASLDAVKIMLTVRDPAGLESSKEKSVSLLQQTYRLYDMFQQPWGEWYPWRFPAYGTDIILNNETGKYTMIYNADRRGLQGIIYAPYRWNITSKNMTVINIDRPEFMPVLGPLTSDGSVSLKMRFEYLDTAWWYSYWSPYWGFSDTIFEGGQKVDGYYLGVVYDVVMNRQAAESWLGMPQTDDPVVWWSTNGDDYKSSWIDWILNEGNIRLDIYSGYEFPYCDMGTMMNLSVLGNGDLRLEIGHISWGYEVLITRWFTEIDLCDHEPYYEDVTMLVNYGTAVADLWFDAVCQYSLHAVLANESATNEGAWVWEPQLIDYVDSSTGHPSRFDPWMSKTYQSWNAGDPFFGLEVGYDSGLQYFNLTDCQKFIIEMPQGNNVLGYYAEPMPLNAITKIIRGTPSDYGIVYPRYPRGDGSIYNYEAYWPLMYNGTMSLGWVGNSTSNPDLSAMYDPVTNTVTMVGPMNFDNTHHDNGALYHGAPWIEFNVTPVVEETPTLTLSHGTNPNGFKFTIVSASSAVPWGDVTIALSDGYNLTAWGEFTTEDLTGTPPAVWTSGGKTIGPLLVFLNITDLAGNGAVNPGDYFTLATYGTPFKPGLTYVVEMIYEPTSGVMCHYEFVA